MARQLPSFFVFIFLFFVFTPVAPSHGHSEFFGTSELHDAAHGDPNTRRIKIKALGSGARLTVGGVLCSDADGDLLCDDDDVCPNDGLNDADGDLICVGASSNPPATGGADNCASDANGDQSNGDGDGLGDACDLCAADAGAAELACLGAGKWLRGQAMPTARSNAGLAEVDGLIYVISGQQSASVEIYDPATDAWSDGIALPGDRNHLQPVVVAGRIHILGGLLGVPGPSTDEVLMFDPATPELGWQVRAAMPTSRGAAACAADGIKIYCAGGLSITNGDMAVSVLEVYNTVSDSWTTLSPMPRNRDHAFGHIIDGKLYVIGGLDSGLENTLEFTDIYDIATDSWSSGAALPEPRGGYASAVVQDRILIFGGEGVGPFDGAYNNADEYDPATDSWRLLPDLPTPRQGFGAPLSKGRDGVHPRLYLIGGSPRGGGGSTTVNEIFQYDRCLSDSGCDDLDPCTVDSCDDVTAQCAHAQLDAPTAECPDPDNDGLDSDVDPCPLDARNACAGTPAIDRATGNEIRVNANVSTEECSGDKTDCNGDLWFADFGYNQEPRAGSCDLGGGGEGCVIEGIVEIFGCDDESTEDLFQCEHSDNSPQPDLIYTFDVPNGDYVVNLFFANSFSGTPMPGGRVFDILVEGALAYDDFDQVLEARDSGRAVVRSALTSVADGDGLSVQLVKVEENPAIKAIEVLRVPGGATTTTTTTTTTTSTTTTTTTTSTTTTTTLPPQCAGDADCEDGDACTIDVCDGGTCAAKPLVCDGGAGCVSVICDHEVGCRKVLDDAACDDGEICTDDICLESGECTYEKDPSNDPSCEPATTTTTTTSTSTTTISTTTTLPPSGECSPHPLDGCHKPRWARLTFIDPGFPSLQHARWKWRTREELSPDAFGEPMLETAQRLCVYDSKDGTHRLATSFEVPAGDRWHLRSHDRHGDLLFYYDRHGSSDGVLWTKMATGGRRGSRIAVFALGKNVPIPEPFSKRRMFANDPSVVAQLQNDVGECFTSKFGEHSLNWPFWYEGFAR